MTPRAARPAGAALAPRGIPGVLTCSAAGRGIKTDHRVNQAGQCIPYACACGSSGHPLRVRVRGAQMAGLSEHEGFCGFAVPMLRALLRRVVRGRVRALLLHVGWPDPYGGKLAAGGVRITARA